MKKFFKILYSKIPCKKQFFVLIKKIGVPPHSVYQHLYFSGVIDVQIEEKKFRIEHNGHTIENELFWTGINDCWEKNSLKIWADLAKSSRVIFDIGANTGVYSLIAKTVNHQTSVHAFEPFPSICKTLNRNSQLNRYDIQCNCAAISNYSGEGVIYSEDENFAYSVTVNKNLWVKNTSPFEIPINTITLKDYIEQKKIDEINLMKIDVETHEPEVMEGFGEYFLKFKPIVLIEVLNDEISEKLSNYFPAENNDFYNIDEVKGIKKVSKLTKSADFNFLIVPREKSFLFDFEKYVSYS